MGNTSYYRGTPTAVRRGWTVIRRGSPTVGVGQLSRGSLENLCVIGRNVLVGHQVLWVTIS
uniref:Uncharacterized protein n=1 Tax=Cucumis melo TaxID=3656 RepID=A0A9I9D987_CUCME